MPKEKANEEFKAPRIPLSVQCSTGPLTERRSSGRSIVPSAIFKYTAIGMVPRDLRVTKDANYNRKLEEGERDEMERKLIGARDNSRV